MDPLRHVKTAVRSLGAYTLAAREARVKINQNENPYDLPEGLKRRVVEKALSRPWSRYPDFDPKELLEALARSAGWRADGILAGNGSNELIEALLLATVGPGTRIVIPEPTFTLYAHLTTILGGEAVRVRMVPAAAERFRTASVVADAEEPAGTPRRRQSSDATRQAGQPADSLPLRIGRIVPNPARADDTPGARAGTPGIDAAHIAVAAPGQGARAQGDRGGAAHGLVYDVEALLDARRQSGASLTIVCSPNNPTGTCLPIADVERLCADADSLVVIDEAYHEFSGQTVVPLLERHPNLVVLRTFSKAMALAGLRIGYLLASPELAREVNKARLPYNLNFFSQTAAMAALEEKGALEGAVRRLVEARGRLLVQLADLPGVRVWSSRANFFLLELLSADPRAVFEGLHRRGVLVRDVTSYPMLERCLRVSVGSEEENEAFLRALGAALGEAGLPLAEGRA
jgi:histidinol-phosphate/aromatic aminotransferase/cobyric acid decarboxylase-like protein